VTFFNHCKCLFNECHAKLEMQLLYRRVHDCVEEWMFILEMWSDYFNAVMFGSNICVFMVIIDTFVINTH
jgi:hypothetical protein